MGIGNSHGNSHRNSHENGGVAENCLKRSSLALPSKMRQKWDEGVAEDNMITRQHASFNP